MKKIELEKELSTATRRYFKAESILIKCAEEIQRLEAMVASNRMYLTILAGRLLSEKNELLVSLADVQATTDKFQLSFEFSEDDAETVVIKLIPRDEDLEGGVACGDNYNPTTTCD